MGRRSADRANAGLPCAIALLIGIPAVAHAHAPSEAAKQRMLDGSLVDFAWVGAEHMLTGYDHLLFLLGVVLFLTSLRQVVAFVTAFTVGHTLTLVVATPRGWGVEPHLIDAIIALTVIYKAFENLDGFRRVLGVAAPPLLLMVFVFGLIHGLGLSTRLQEMTLARDPQLVPKVLAFNVGVELGQIAALAVMVAVLRLWRASTVWPALSRGANAALIAAGALLFVQQVHGFLTAPEPDTAPAPQERSA